MNFYIIDDVQETKRLQAQSNLDTNTAYRREWCEAWAVNRKTEHTKDVRFADAQFLC